MKLVFAFIFTVLCKPGFVYNYDGQFMELSGDKKEYYYYELDYEDGTYLYVSILKDSVYFSVSGDEVYYELYKPSNEEFEFKNQ